MPHRPAPGSVTLASLPSTGEGALMHSIVAQAGGGQVGTRTSVGVRELADQRQLGKLRSWAGRRAGATPSAAAAYASRTRSSAGTACDMLMHHARCAACDGSRATALAVFASWSVMSPTHKAPKQASCTHPKALCPVPEPVCSAHRSLHAQLSLHLKGWQLHAGHSPGEGCWAG